MKKRYANMDTITADNQWYENNFVSVLEDRYTPEEVKKLLAGESIINDDGSEDFIHQEDDGELSVTFF